MALVAFLFGVAGRPELKGSGLRALLGELGLSDDAARALLSRMHRGGQLTAERHGRETTYRLTGSFARGFEHIRQQASARSPAWDGWFHTVLYRVPEESRSFRDALRRTAVMSGYGILQPGILVAPRDYRDQLTAQLAGKPDQSHILFGRLAMDNGDAARVVTTAWRLDEVAEIFDSHIARIERCLSLEPPQNGPEELRALRDNSGAGAVRDAVRTVGARRAPSHRLAGPDASPTDHPVLAEIRNHRESLRRIPAVDDTSRPSRAP